MASRDHGAVKPTSWDARPPAPILFHPNLLRSWGHDNAASGDDSSSATLVATSEDVAPTSDSPSATMGTSVAETKLEMQRVTDDRIHQTDARSTDVTSGGMSSDQTDETVNPTSDITEIASNQYRNVPLGNKDLIASDVIVVSEGGGITLTIGAEANKAAFLVSHTCLEIKCPKLLQQVSKSAFNEKRFYVFDGYDWDLLPMRIILDMAHGNLHRLPRWVTLSTLAQMSQLAEDCDLVELLLPFVSHSLLSLARQAHTAHLSWVHIAWVFGFRELFHAQVKHHIEHATWMNGELSLFEPDDMKQKGFLSNGCVDGPYDIIKQSRLQRLEKLSAIIIKHFSSLSNWCKDAPCQLNDETVAYERNECAMLRYAFFQGAINENFKTLETNPHLVRQSVKSCVAALLHIDCSAASMAQSQKVGHGDCGLHAFKEAVYSLYEFDELKNESLLELVQNHFVRDDTPEVCRLSDDAMFGTRLHPAFGLFIEADIPSEIQMAKHRKTADKRKAIKVFKQEPDLENQGAAAQMSPGRSRANSAGLFVSDVTDNTHINAEEDLPLGRTPPSASVIECLDSDNELPDDTYYDGDLYDDDTEWELDSNCSTEPDDEFFENINEIEVYRQLRGVDQTTPPVEKRKRTQAVDLTADGEGSDESPERKRKKLEKEEKKARKEVKKLIKEERKKMN